jgi:uncharacterized protein
MPTPSHALPLSLLPGTYAVCRLDSGSPVPDWALSGPFFSVTRTRGELSIVCEEGSVPDGVLSEPGWRCIKIEAALPFGLVGILVSTLQPLAEAGVGIFAMSTYDTDYILVKSGDLDGATAALTQAGHRFA